MTKLDEIFAKSKKSTESLLETSKGKLERVYKLELFVGMNEKQIKSSRKKIRNYVNSIFESIISLESKKESAKVTKLVNEFNSFYKETYLVNDYSFASVASENSKNKDTINKALAIIKTTLKIK
jgi:hypothetical protein